MLYNLELYVNTIINSDRVRRWKKEIVAVSGEIM
jgi:hypothetical protein